MEEGSDILEAGVSPGASPSYVNNVEGATVDAHSEDYMIDPLSNPPADVSAVDNNNENSGTTLEWLAIIKKEEGPLRDMDEADGDEEDAGTSSFENLSPLSDDVQGSIKGFRKVLGIKYICMW